MRRKYAKVNTNTKEELLQSYKAREKEDMRIIRSLVRDTMRDIHFCRSIGQRAGLHSDTTLVGFVCEGGNKVLMAADRLLTDTDGRVVLSLCHKLFVIGTNAILAGSGVWADVQNVVSVEETLADSTSRETGEELSAEGKLNLLRTALGNQEAPLCSFVFGGYDGDIGAFTFCVSGSGSSYQRRYISIGSGGMAAEDVLDQFWNIKLSSTQALELSIKSLIQASKRCVSTSDSILFPPDVAFISKDGIELVSEVKIMEVVNSMTSEYFKRQVEAEG